MNRARLKRSPMVCTVVTLPIFDRQCADAPTGRSPMRRWLSAVALAHLCISSASAYSAVIWINHHFLFHRFKIGRSSSQSQPVVLARVRAARSCLFHLIRVRIMSFNRSDRHIVSILSLSQPLSQSCGAAHRQGEPRKPLRRGSIKRASRIQSVSFPVT